MLQTVQAMIGPDTLVGMKHSKHHHRTLVNCCCPYNEWHSEMSTDKTTKSSRAKKLPVIANRRLLDKFDTVCHQTSEQQHTPYSGQHLSLIHI